MIKDGHLLVGFLAVRRKEREERMQSKEKKEKSSILWITGINAVELEE